MTHAGVTYAGPGWSVPAELWPAAVTRCPNWRRPTMNEQAKQTHTPGPWTWWSPKIERTVVHGACSQVCEMNSGRPFAEANAARIVACVNACEGLADPSGVPALIAAVNRLWAAKEALEITDNPQDATILRELYNAWLDLRDARNKVEGH